MSSKTENGPPVATASPPPPAPARSEPAAVNVLGAVLRLLVAATSRLAQLLGRPSWAVRAVFALESKRLKLEARSKP